MNSLLLSANLIASLIQVCRYVTMIKKYKENMAWLHQLMFLVILCLTFSSIDFIVGKLIFTFHCKNSNTPLVSFIIQETRGVIIISDLVEKVFNFGFIF